MEELLDLLRRQDISHSREEGVVTVPLETGERITISTTGAGGWIMQLQKAEGHVVAGVSHASAEGLVRHLIKVSGLISIGKGE